MAEPFVGEIRIFGGNFAPIGHAFCNGQLLPIAQNTALFSLLGTIYGGDGKSTFALPNLQNSTPIHQGQGPGLSLRSIGESAGQSTETLQVSEMPSHAHLAGCDSGGGTQPSPANNMWAASAVGRTPPPYYSDATTGLVAMSPSAIGLAGGGQPDRKSVV